MTWSTMGNSHKSDPNPKLPFRSQPHESPEFHNIGQDISVIEHDGIHRLESIAHDSGRRPQAEWAIDSDAMSVSWSKISRQNNFS